LSFITGAIAWSGHTFTIAFSLVLFPLLSFLQRRTEAFAAAAAYYAGSTWPVVPGAAVFFGTHAGVIEGMVVWILGSCTLAIPFGLLWSKNRQQNLWRYPLAVIMTAIPPLGILNVGSPLTAAGVLFPGTNWFGLIVTLAICGLLATYPARTSSIVIATALVLNLNYHVIQAPNTWQAVDTSFGGAGINTPSPVEDFQSAMWIQDRIRSSSAKVLIFPENAVYRWNDSTDFFWQETFSQMQQEKKTLLIGAGMTPLGGRGYLNTIVVRGEDQQTPYFQRIPIPVGMWRPFYDDGVPLYPFGRSTFTVAGQRVAPLVCYEQLLIWPVVTSLVYRPTIIIGFSNEYWARDTYIPEIQRSAVAAWARLFSIPYMLAVNR